MGVHPFHGKGPHQSLWAGLWAARGKIIMIGIPKHLKYCVINIYI